MSTKAARRRRKRMMTNQQCEKGGGPGVATLASIGERIGSPIRPEWKWKAPTRRRGNMDACARYLWQRLVEVCEDEKYVEIWGTVAGSAKPKRVENGWRWPCRMFNIAECIWDGLTRNGFATIRNKMIDLDLVYPEGSPGCNASPSVYVIRATEPQQVDTIRTNRPTPKPGVSVGGPPVSASSPVVRPTVTPMGVGTVIDSKNESTHAVTVRGDDLIPDLNSWADPVAQLTAGWQRVQRALAEIEQGKRDMADAAAKISALKFERAEE